MALPEYESPSINQSKLLGEAKVASVTTAALHREGADGSEHGDDDYRY